MYLYLKEIYADKDFVMGRGIFMKKVSLRVRNFEQEKFLTFNIDNEASLDEELLDFIEDEEPRGIVPVIFEEGEEFDTFSYNITDRIRLNELSGQEVSAEITLKVLRSLVLALIDMAEYRIPVSYLVLNRSYIYVDSDYKIDFICIPLEEMQEEVNLNSFLRSFLASLRFESSENGDYVARLLSYINNPAVFNLHNLIALIEGLMSDMGVEVPEDDSVEIYAEYHEVEETPEIHTEEETLAEEDTDLFDDDIVTVLGNYGQEIEKPDPDMKKTAGEFGIAEEASVKDSDVEELKDELREKEAAEETIEEAVKEEVSIEANEEENVKEETVTSKTDEAAEEAETVGKDAVDKELKIKTKEAAVTGVVIEDDFDEFFAEQVSEEKPISDEKGLKIKKSIKINRASIVQNTKEELKAEDVKEDAETQVNEDKDTKQPAGKSTRNQKKGANGKSNKAPVPKVNPYIIRVNTEERVMIMKQNFKIGKSNIGVDFTIDGNGAVSRVHAIITNKDGSYYIKDNKSTNHTYVNGKMVQDGESELLTHDSKIVLGDEEFVFKLR